MTSELLENADVKRELANIRETVAAVTKRPRKSSVSEFERFFWLKARKTGSSVEFMPSCHDRFNPETDYWICNMILKGGGTLGLAHAGFVAALETAGIRFAGLAGTSAGSIVALVIAAVRGSDLLKHTTTDTVRITESVPLDWFIDGPRPIRMAIKHFLLKRGIASPSVWYWLFLAWRRILGTRGLNQGDNFERWLDGVMAEFDMPTLAALDRHLNKIRKTLVRANGQLARNHGVKNAVFSCGRPRNGDECRQHARNLLKLFASAMPVGLKFELPGQMPLLLHNPDTMSPARLARMSMAIPIFFEPVRMPIDHDQWTESDKSPLWQIGPLITRSEAGAYQRLQEFTFMDGGVFANLPSDAFIRNMPDMPTLIAPLTNTGKPEKFMRHRRTRALFREVVDCVQAMRFQRDLDAYLQRLSQKDDFESQHSSKPNGSAGIPRSFPMRTCSIDTGDAYWLNFVMSNREKQDLFLAGVRAAGTFLSNLGKEESKSCKA